MWSNAADGSPFEQRWTYVDDGVQAAPTVEQVSDVMARPVPADTRPRCTHCGEPVDRAWLISEDGIGPCCFEAVARRREPYDPDAQKEACRASLESNGSYGGSTLDQRFTERRRARAERASRRDWQASLAWMHGARLDGPKR